MAHIMYAYLVEVRKKQSKEALLVGNFDGEGSDLLSEFETFLTDPKHRDWHDKDAEAAARVTQVHPPTKEEPHTLAAMIKAGELGVTSEFVDANADALGEEVVFRRGADHAELVPVLVLLRLEGTKRQGFLVMHSPKNRGVKTKFWARFREWFASRHPDYTLELNGTVPEGFQKQLLESETLKEIKLVRYKEAKDFAESGRGWLREGTRGKITTTVQQAGRFGALSKRDLKSALKDDKELRTLLVFEGQEYDEVTATFKASNGRQHSLYLQGQRATRAGLDVTDKIQEDAGGNATYESLRAAALEYLGILAK